MSRHACAGLSPRSVALACFYTLLAAADHARGASLQRLEVAQGDRTVVFYRLGAAKFREIPAGALGKVQVGLPVCVLGKLHSVQGRRIRLYGVMAANVSFRLAPGVKVDSTPGTNVCVGGTVSRANGQVVMRVAAIAAMDDDIAIFKREWEALGRRPHPTAVEYFRLGWRLQEYEKLASGLSVQRFEQYRACAARAFRKALGIQAAALARAGNDNAVMAGIIRRLGSLENSFAGTPLQGSKYWHVEACRRFLREHAAACAALLAGGKPDPEKRARALAGLHLLQGRMWRRYLDDREEAAKAFLAGAACFAEAPDLAKELAALGYTRFAGKWVTAARARQLERLRQQQLREQANKRARAAAARRRAQAMLRMRAGVGMERRVSVVDALLSRPTTDNLADLASRCKSLPEDLVRYALWRAAGLQDPASGMVVATVALRDRRAAVRGDAAMMLLAADTVEARAALVKHLQQEKSPAVLTTVMAGIRGLPAAQAVPLCIQLLENQAIPPGTRKAAARLLALRSGKKFGLDVFSWKQWWQRRR